MKYSKAVNYALHAVWYMANLSKRRKISVAALSAMLEVSPTYLSKILTQLVKADLIKSETGVGGGYSLKKKKITFLDIICAVEGKNLHFSCEMPHMKSCKIERIINDSLRTMEEYLDNIEIKDIIDSSYPEKTKKNNNILEQELL